MVRVGYKVLFMKVVTLISLLFLQWVWKVFYVHLDSEAGAGRHALGEVRHHAAALCNQHTLDIQISGQATLVLRLRGVCRLVRALRLAAAPRPRPAVRAAVLRPHRGGQQQRHHHHHHRAPHVGVVTI